MKKMFILLAFSFACSYISFAQLVFTLAGSTNTGSANGNGTLASFNNPAGLCVDGSGNVYVADMLNHLIRKTTPTGTVTTLAGSGTQGSANGTGTLASFYNPRALCADASGNIYVADFFNHLIRQITPAGVVSTFAGTGSPGSADGAAASASFNGPSGVCCDASGNIYVSEESGHRIRKISGGTVSTLAGSGAVGSNDATGIAATFNFPGGLCADLSGNIYVADTYNNMIRKITPAGVVTTFAGSGSPAYLNGTGTAAAFNNPTGVSADAAGNIYVADYENNRIRKIDPTGVVTNTAGFGTAGFANGSPVSALFNHPMGVAAYKGDTIYVADRFNGRIRMISTCTPPPPPVNTTPANHHYVDILVSNTLTATSPGTIYWFNAATGGTALATGTVYLTPNTLFPGYYTYYAEALTCTKSATRTPIGFEVIIFEGLNDQQSVKLVKTAYPNPGNGLFTLELLDNSQKKITVTDLNGRILISENATGSKLNFDLSSSPAGLYVVQVSSDKGLQTLKVIKQ